jgi:molecular chaperone GrpE
MSDSERENEMSTNHDGATPSSSQDDSEQGTLDVEALQAALEEQKALAAEYLDNWRRTAADFDNYKKRAAREMQDLARYANEKLIKEILTVVDNLERAIDSATGHYDENDPLIQGVHLTLSETLKILDRHQVKPLTSLGQPFDPSFHQAMMQEEVQGQPPNTVVKELQKGYLIHDRLLRPALVAVSKTGGDVKQNNN